MRRTLAAMSIIVVALLAAACGGAAPPSASGAAASSAAASVAGDAGGLPETELTVEQLCAALTAEELAEVLGEEVTIDPTETVWCGYDLEDGSGMFVVGNDDTAEGFVEQALGFDCEAKPVEGGAVLSSCGTDKEEGRPTEAWFLLDGVGVQLSVDAEATEAQYLEMIREALD